MIPEAQTTPAPKLTSTARLLLRVLASDLSHPRTLTEIERLTPCSRASASILARQLERTGILKSYAPEFGVPRVYTIASLRLLTGDEPLAALLADLEPTVTKPNPWAEVNATLLALVTSEPITAGELILRSGYGSGIVADWLHAVGANGQISTTFREFTTEERFSNPRSGDGVNAYTLA